MKVEPSFSKQPFQRQVTENCCCGQLVFNNLFYAVLRYARMPRRISFTESRARRSTKSRRGLAGLGSASAAPYTGERRSLPRPMAAIVAPKPLSFLTTLTIRSSLARLPTRRSTQTSCSSAGRRGPAVAATPRPGVACRVHSRLRSLLPPSAAASPPTAAAAEGIRRVRISDLLQS